MEQEIHFTDSKFDFSQISISQPISVQGGAYFTKIKCNTSPLYIQLPKCFTKQGLNETNKKAYIDLMFTNDDYEVVEWFEHLEETLVNLIYEKRELWFQNEMDKEDIENFFNPVCRSFKGGKFHLIRFNVPKNKTMNSQYRCNVYDENENIIPIQDLNETHTIIPCLEVQGIKFSARNFQLELVGKQIMLLNNKPIFNSCIIKRTTDVNKSNSIDNSNSSPLEVMDNTIDSNLLNNDTTTDIVMDSPEKELHTELIETENDVINKQVKHENNDILSETSDSTRLYTNLEEHETEDDSIKGLQTNIMNTLAESSNDSDNDSIVIPNKEIDKDNSLEEIKKIEEVSGSLEEVNGSLEYVNGLEDITNNINISNDNSNINLKKPNEVYYEIYKIAKEKAKQHKKASITHYLEAKKIKNTYLLDSLDDSDESTEYESEIESDVDSVKNEINEFIEELN